MKVNPEEYSNEKASVYLFSYNPYNPEMLKLNSPI